MFSDGVGLLQGHYHIRLDSNAVPVQHAPRRVPVLLHACLKETLDDLVRQEILAPEEQPTPWISSMVVVPKKRRNIAYLPRPQRPQQSRPT